MPITDGHSKSKQKARAGYLVTHETYSEFCMKKCQTRQDAEERILVLSTDEEVHKHTIKVYKLKECKFSLAKVTIYSK